MCANHRSEVVRAAADYLGCEGCARAPFTVTICCDGYEVTMPCRCWPQPCPPPEPPPSADGWAAFSPLEAKIVGCLRGKGWLVTADMAAAVGEEPSTDFRCVVRNLGERGVLETHQRLGVRLAEAARDAG